MARQRVTEKEERNRAMFRVYKEVMNDYEPEVRTQLTKQFICEKVKERGPFFVSVQTIRKEINNMLRDKGMSFFNIP